jgi:hypothetical protein
MFTVVFVILKFFSFLILSWWWIVVAIALDVYLRKHLQVSVRNAYLLGYEEGKQEEDKEDDLAL